MIVAYSLFGVLVLSLIALDLGVLNRKAHAPTLREAIGYTVLWVSVGLAFTGAVYLGYEHEVFGLGQGVPQLGGHAARTVAGGEAAVLYLTGYALEKALALDNLFVMLFVFRTLKISDRYQHRVLFWGILGALVLRGGMIAVGAALVHRFEWILYVFGALLVWSGLKLLRGTPEAQSDEDELPPLVRLLHRFVPVDSTRQDGFLVKTPAGWALTTSLLALISIELADVVFAIDSIPAIFAVTLDPFIVFTSNVMAVLGLRSLYFVLAAAADRLQHLAKALAFVLVFVGIKMIALYWDLHVPAVLSLAIIALTMIVGIVASLYARRKPAAPVEEEPTPPALP